MSGLDDILAKPPLSMAQECERDLAWQDWLGSAQFDRPEDGRIFTLPERFTGTI